MKALLPFAMCVMLSACATAYHPSGFTGGFSEIPMAQDVYKIRFKGNGFTNSEAATEMALLRAAELTLKSGYSHFIVTSEGESTSTSYIAQPGVTTTTLQSTGSGFYARSLTSPGFLMPIDKPRTELVVRMLRDGSTGGLDARQVYNSYAPRYIKHPESIAVGPAPVSPTPAQAPSSLAEPAATPERVPTYRCGTGYTTQPTGQDCVLVN